MSVGPSVRRLDVIGVQDTVAAVAVFALVVSVSLSPDSNGFRWAMCQSSFQISCSQCPRSSWSLSSTLEAVVKGRWVRCKRL